MTGFWFYAFLILGIGFSILVGCFGMGALVTYRHNQKQVQLSFDWEEGKAKVIRTRIDKGIAYDEVVQNASYTPRVDYVYQVDGQIFLGTRISFGQPNYLQIKKVEEILARYPLGSEVSVYYDPLSPEEAVLERITFVPMAYLLTGISLTAMMILILGLMAYWWIFENQAVKSFLSV